MQFDAQHTQLFIPGPVGQLETTISRPQQPLPVVGIVCHPHSQQGGTADNKVVTTVAKAFNNLGVWSIRFNFRSVGKSAGEYAHGIGETDDLLAVFDWAQANFPQHNFWLAGFSFGAYVALRAVHQRPVAQLLTIAPPIRHFDLAQLPVITCPWWLVQGDQDEVVAAADVLAWASQCTKPPHIIEMQNVGHFFHGRLVELRTLLEQALGKML